MKRVHVLAEGQTEETFVRDVLGPHLLAHDVYVTPVIVSTKRVLAGQKFRGGVVSFGKLKSEILNLLRDKSAAAVTTLIDFYGLPDDCPWPPSAPRSLPRERVSAVELLMAQDIGSPRFIPHLSLHEFEAFLFVEPATTAAVLAPETPQELAQALATVREQFDGPEDINAGPTTHPSRRIADAWRRYNKVRHGPLTAARVGLPALRAACPHFDAWVARLEML